MKTSILITAAIIGCSTAVAQMPPPPPGAPGMGVDGSQQMERREIRQIIIRGDEDGPRGMRFMGGSRGMEPFGLFLDTRPVDSLVRSLDLTPQQLGKITEHSATARQEMRKIMQQIMAESRRMRELSPADAKYAALSAETAKKVGDLSSKLVEQSSALRAKVWEVLTPEQRAKADVQLKEMRERMQQRKRGDGKGRHQHGDRDQRPRAFILDRPGGND